MEISRGWCFCFNEAEYAFIEYDDEGAPKSRSEYVSFVNHNFIIGVIFVSPVEYELSHKNGKNDDSYHEHHQRVNVENSVKQSE